MVFSKHFKRFSLFRRKLHLVFFSKYEATKIIYNFQNYITVSRAVTTCKAHENNDVSEVIKLVKDAKNVSSSQTQRVKKNFASIISPAVMSSSPKKKKQRLPEPPSLLSLPDDLLWCCLSRVPRVYYRTVSLVSKRFQSLVASQELYKTRSLTDRTEASLYVGLVFPSDPNPRWFTLCRRSDQALRRKKNKKASGLVLATVSIHHPSPPMHSLGVVAVGSHIYNIGGPIEKGPSSRVSIFDCRSNTWSEAPSMSIERYYPACNYFDGKIYVTGGCGKGNALSWMEVLDIKTQTWKFVVNSFEDRCEHKLFKSAVLDGELCIFGHKGVGYIPQEGRWEKEGRMVNMNLGWASGAFCVIDDILYSYTVMKGIQWFDIKVGGGWRKLNGMEGLPKFAAYCCTKLANYGGKLVVLWDKYVRPSRYTNKMIWCAMIKLERHNATEMSGVVESLDDILTVPKGYEFVCALSATV